MEKEYSENLKKSHCDQTGDPLPSDAPARLSSYRTIVILWKTQDIG